MGTRKLTCKSSIPSLIAGSEVLCTMKTKNICMATALASAVQRSSFPKFFFHNKTKHYVIPRRPCGLECARTAPLKTPNNNNNKPIFFSAQKKEEKEKTSFFAMEKKFLEEKSFSLKKRKKIAIFLF